MTRDQVVQHLERHGVETRALIAGNLARHPAVAQIEHRVAPSMAACDALLRNALMIGCHPVLEPGSRTTLEAAIRSTARKLGLDDAAASKLRREALGLVRDLLELGALAFVR